MFETTVAGSLPKPAWLAEPQRLWAPWRLEGPLLDEGKRDATILAVKEQEAAGIDIVSDGEQAREHFVHGFLHGLDGIDFDKKVRMGIRDNRYEADVPTVTGPLKRRASVHAMEARAARSHTTRKLKFTLPGPMTIADTIATRHYGDRATMAKALAGCSHAHVRRPALRRPRADGGGAGRLPQRRGAGARGDRHRRHPVRRAGLQRLSRCRHGVGHRGAPPRDRGPSLQDGGPHLLRLRHQG